MISPPKQPDQNSTKFCCDLLTQVGFSPVENQNDLELDFKVFSLLILAV